MPSRRKGDFGGERTVHNHTGYGSSRPMVALDITHRWVIDDRITDPEKCCSTQQMYNTGEALPRVENRYPI